MEVLVAAALVTLVLSGAWMVFSLGDRSRGVTATARALQTAMLIQETMTNDLARLIAPGQPFRFDREKPRRIGFYVIDPAHTPPSGEIGVRAVEYRLDGAHQLLVREHDAKADPIGSSPLVDAQFRPFRSTTGPLLRVVLQVGRTKDDPAGPPFFHTFLIRPNLRVADERVPTRALSDFASKEEPKKGADQLPVPPDMFRR